MELSILNITVSERVDSRRRLMTGSYVDEVFHRKELAEVCRRIIIIAAI